MTNKNTQESKTNWQELMREDSNKTLDYTMDAQTLHQNLLSLRSQNTRLEKENNHLKEQNNKLLKYISNQNQNLILQKLNSDRYQEKQLKKQSLASLQIEKSIKQNQNQEASISIQHKRSLHQQQIFQSKKKITEIQNYYKIVIQQKDQKIKQLAFEKEKLNSYIKKYHQEIKRQKHISNMLQESLNTQMMKNIANVKAKNQQIRVLKLQIYNLKTNLMDK